MLYDFIQTTAFRQTSVTASLGVSGGQAALIAKVTPGTTNQVKPTGKVKFSLSSGGQEHYIGQVPVRSDGTATLKLTPAQSRARTTIKAVYSGDQYYNAATSK